MTKSLGRKYENLSNLLAILEIKPLLVKVILNSIKI